MVYIFEHELNELNEFLLKLATEKLFVLFGLFVLKKILVVYTCLVLFYEHESHELNESFMLDSCEQKIFVLFGRFVFKNN